MDAGGENLVFSFSRAQGKAFLDAFSKNFAFVQQVFFIQQKIGGAMAHPAPPGAWSLQKNIIVGQEGWIMKWEQLPTQTERTL